MKRGLLSLILCLFLIGGKAQRSEPVAKEFEIFWKKLYGTIVKKDFQAMSNYIEFPLVVKKSLSDPTVQTVTREDFAKFFNKYLDMPANDSFTSKYDLLRARKVLSEDDLSLLSDDSATIEDFEFQKVDGQWKLVYVYATE